MTDRILIGGIELVSPIFQASRGSTWRKQVEEMWKFLGQYYDITGGQSCGTHFHISIEPCFTLPQLKRIAQAAIQFEPAIEALIPASRRGNKYAKSNWLDNPSLGHYNLSRSECIDKIAKVRNAEELVEMMGDTFDRDYSWNFTSLRCLKKPTLEFRKPPVCTTVEQTLGWAEFTISFVQAAIKCSTSERLHQVPPTVQGLRWFLEQGHEPAVNEPSLLNVIFNGKPANAALAPKPRPEDYFFEPVDIVKWRGRLQGKGAEDIKQILKAASDAYPPYWI